MGVLAMGGESLHVCMHLCKVFPSVCLDGNKAHLQSKKKWECLRWEVKASPAARKFDFESLYIS